MKLIPCPCCGKPISSTAPACPQCGHAPQSGTTPQSATGLLAAIVLGLLVGGVAVVAFSSYNPSTERNITPAHWVIIASAALLYFVPSYVAARRRKANSGAIAVLNIFLGWTLLGWVIALVWATAKDAKA